MSLAPDSNVNLDKDSLIGPAVDSDQKTTIRHSAHVNFSYAAAAWLSLLAAPLILFPRILSVVFASLLTATPEAEGTPELIRQLNILERSLAGLAGISCLTLAAVLVVQTGALPLTSSLSASNAIHNASAQAPFRAPTIAISVVYFSALAYYTYDLGLWVATGPSAALSVWGLWALLFAHQGRANVVGGPDKLKGKFQEKTEDQIADSRKSR
ncbi:hypothetical protein BCR35DRAFT_308748 [Leucosporidium creatinivorum]|uniref:Uncharacterized protein n=1 Tax=Leucosporidium creatinivorum TaxID=106004 RepID=A0A1Y2DXF1_9BASI|nr:hypothetical protein BCR35DRAFT_308748 [Leucosporidium creatinivorum]